jgi:hypothetical protein
MDLIFWILGGLLALETLFLSIQWRRARRERSATERALAVAGEWQAQAKDCLNGWTRSSRLHKDRLFDAIYWFIAWVVMSALALWFAWKLDLLAKNGIR